MYGNVMYAHKAKLYHWYSKSGGYPAVIRCVMGSITRYGDSLMNLLAFPSPHFLTTQIVSSRPLTVTVRVEGQKKLSGTQNTRLKASPPHRLIRARSALYRSPSPCGTITQCAISL
jgi:hypothetical protein